MRLFVIPLVFLVACGGGGGDSDSASNVKIHDCDVDSQGNPVVEEDSETKELTLICGDGQVGDNTTTTNNQPE